MQTAPPPTRDVALESRVFWLRFRKEIIALIVLALLGILGFAGYKFYTDRQEGTAATMLSQAKTSADFEQVIARYPNTPAGASAYLFKADQQRTEKKFAEANATLQTFANKNPEHELASTARMAIAANLESMGQADEALAVYQQVANTYPTSFNAPLALISRVHLLKAKNRNDEARQVCEIILTKYRESNWAREAGQELHFLRPSTPPATATTVPANAPGGAPTLLARPPAAPPPAPSAAATAKPK